MTEDLLNIVIFMRHKENRQNLSIFRMGTDMLSQHDKMTANLLNVMSFMLHAEKRQNLSIFRMGKNVPSQHSKTTAHLLKLISYMLHAENVQNLSIFRMAPNMLSQPGGGGSGENPVKVSYIFPNQSNITPTTRFFPFFRFFFHTKF